MTRPFKKLLSNNLLVFLKVGLKFCWVPITGVPNVNIEEFKKEKI